MTRQHVNDTEYCVIRNRSALIAIGVLAFGLASCTTVPTPQAADDALLALRTYERWAWAVGIVLIWADLLLPVPQTAVIAALGVVYGTVLGGLLGSLGLITGGLLGYGLTFTAARRLVQRLAGRHALHRMEGLFSRSGAWAIVLTRSLPYSVPEATVILAGLAGMPLTKFVAALTVGSVPTAFAFAAIGAGWADQPLLALVVSSVLPILLLPLALSLMRLRAGPVRSEGASPLARKDLSATHRNEEHHRREEYTMNVKRAIIMAGVRQFGHPRGVVGSVAGWVMAHRASNRQRNSWVAALLDVQPADRVLEIGFGPGLAIAELSRRVGPAGHVYGVDHSGVMLRQATGRNAAAIEDGRVTLTLGTVERLPSALDGPFDAIFAVNSLGFWPRPAERLQELRRRLRPGGRIAIASQPRCPGATRKTSLDAAREIADLLQAAGFSETRTEILDLAPPVVCVLAVNQAPAHGRPPER